MRRGPARHRSTVTPAPRRNRGQPVTRSVSLCRHRDPGVSRPRSRGVPGQTACRAGQLRRAETNRVGPCKHNDSNSDTDVLLGHESNVSEPNQGSWPKVPWPLSYKDFVFWRLSVSPAKAGEEMQGHRHANTILAPLDSGRLLRTAGSTRRHDLPHQHHIQHRGAGLQIDSVRFLF